MIESLYIKNNLRKNLSNYINIILIITISIVTINILNIYLDSLFYGDRQDTLQRSNGYLIWIEGADESDLPFFSSIPGVTATLDSSKIYIKFINKNDIQKIQKTIRTIRQIINDNNLDVFTHDYAESYVKSNVPNEQVLLFNILRIIFASIGMISTYFIYLIFIENKKSDLSILLSLGMDNKSLKKFLLTELFIIYAVSYLLGLFFSNIIMYFIISNLLYTTNENIVTVIYKFTFSSTVILFIVSFTSVITAYFISLNKILNIPLIQNIKLSASYSEIKRNTSIWNKVSAEKFISLANLLRNKRISTICFILTTPVIIISSVFFNYLNLFNAPTSDIGDFTIINYIDIYNYADIIENNIFELQKIDGIDKLEYSAYYNNLVMDVNPAKLNFPVYTIYKESGKEYFHRVYLRVRKNEELTGKSFDSESYVSGNGVLLSCNTKSMKYKVGDTIILRDPIQVHTEPVQTWTEDIDKKTLAISGFIDVPQYGDSIFIYVSEQGFEKITGHPAIPNKVDVFLKQDADYETVKEQIYTLFGKTEIFSILNNVEKSQAMAQMVCGIGITAAILCGVLIIIIIILIAAFIDSYIQSQKSQIQTLSALGASNKTLVKISVYESVVKGAFNSAIGLVIGTFISYIVIKMSGYNFYINHYFFFAYALISLIIIAVFILSAYVSVSKIIKPTEANDVNIKDIAANENI